MFRFLLSASLSLTCLPGFTQSGKVSFQDKTLIELRRSLERPASTVPAGSISRHAVIHPGLATGSLKKTSPSNLAVAPIPPAWQYQDLAIFCQLEVKMEKALKLPVKIRLGEVRYVEKMEGKLKTFDSRE